MREVTFFNYYLITIFSDVTRSTFRGAADLPLAVCATLEPLGWGGRD